MKSTTKTYMGIVSMGHDASISVVRDHKILFAGHAERYSRIKNDGQINTGLMNEALSFGEPDEVVWYERPWRGYARMLWNGQVPRPLDLRNHIRERTGYRVRSRIHTVGHHAAHAAGGYFTSGFQDASVLVCDAVGDWECMSVWRCEGQHMRKVWSSGYPHSLGLLYTAMTQRCGLKANEEEYILMGMAALGTPRYVEQMKTDFLQSKTSAPAFRTRFNTHRGVKGWMPDLVSQQDLYDIAASVQALAENYLKDAINWIRDRLPSRNLILSGGVALNCKANTEIARQGVFDNIWIMPNPGDAGSSLGAIAAHIRQPLEWSSPYLGTHIHRMFNVSDALEALKAGRVIGVANDRAEFGPRALGNRSLLADPRGSHVKDQVNQIKHREPFRPFAPMVLEDQAQAHFEMLPAVQNRSPYMQFTMKCTHPELYPAICHYDGTSRVQTMNSAQNPKIHGLLSAFYRQTGCPMLLNTSLNIKGQPLVNSWADAQEFRALHGVEIF